LNSLTNYKVVFSTVPYTTSFYQFLLQLLVFVPLMIAVSELKGASFRVAIACLLFFVTTSKNTMSFIREKSTPFLLEEETKGGGVFIAPQ